MRRIIFYWRFVGVSFLLQCFVILFLVKYSVYFFLISEIWICVSFFLNCLVIEVGGFYMLIFYMIMFFSLCSNLVFIFWIEMGYLGGLFLFIYLFLLKQILVSSFILFLRFRDFGFGFIFYVLNSKFILFWFIFGVIDSICFRVYFIFIFSGRVFILFCLILWFSYLLIFVVLLLMGKGREYFFVYIFFSQLMLFFSFFLTLKCFYICLLVDIGSYVFFSYIFLIISDGRFLYRMFVCNLIYFFFVFVFMSFVFSLPPFPSFYLEVGYLFWLYFLFSFRFGLSLILLFGVFLFIMLYFFVLIIFFFRSLVGNLRTSRGWMLSNRVIVFLVNIIVGYMVLWGFWLSLF